MWSLYTKGLRDGKPQEVLHSPRSPRPWSRRRSFFRCECCGGVHGKERKDRVFIKTKIMATFPLVSMARTALLDRTGNLLKLHAKTLGESGYFRIHSWFLIAMSVALLGV